jgi:hypothetical protein
MLLRKELSGIDDPLLLSGVAIGLWRRPTSNSSISQATGHLNLNVITPLSPQFPSQCLRLLGDGPALSTCSAEASQLAEDLQE